MLGTGGFTFLAAILSALVCGALYLYQRFVGVRSGSLALITQSVDSRNHVIVAASVTAGLIASRLHFPLLDTLVGLVVAVLILKSAIELTLETVRSFGEEDVDLSRYQMGLAGWYHRFRQAQLRDWLLYLVEKQKMRTRSNLMILGGLGPAMAEITLIFALGSRQQKRDYRHRVLDVKRIGWTWAAVILLMFPALNTIATLLSVATGGPQPAVETATRLLTNPLSFIPYLLFLFVFGPLPEELGWSGYALDGLQSRRSALASSLIIGVIWAMWHLPLFFMEGTFQSEQIGFATPAFWWYMLPTLPISVLDTWIYNNAHRSTLSAVLLHFMVNLSGELFGLTQHATFYQAGLVFLVTAVITAIWGPKTLTRK